MDRKELTRQTLEAGLRVLDVAAKRLTLRAEKMREHLSNEDYFLMHVEMQRVYDEINAYLQEIQTELRPWLRQAIELQSKNKLSPEMRDLVKKKLGRGTLLLPNGDPDTWDPSGDDLVFPTNEPVKRYKRFSEV